MNQKDMKKLETLKNAAISCNATTSYRVALVFIDTKKQTLDSCGDPGIRDFITKNKHQILALPNLEMTIQLEQPTRPLKDMTVKELRDFTANMLKTINGGKKIYRYNPTNQPSWWDNSISLWTDGLQKNGKSLGRDQYRDHIRKCYSHYNIVIESDEDIDDVLPLDENAPVDLGVVDEIAAGSMDVVQEPLAESTDSNSPSVGASSSRSDGLDESTANSEVCGDHPSPILVTRRPQRSRVLTQLTPAPPDNYSGGLHTTDIDRVQVPAPTDDSYGGIQTTDIDSALVPESLKAVYKTVHFRDW